MSYVDVNGLHMYYESHGSDTPGARPLVLLHGALSSVATSFGLLLPELAKGRRVIAFEQQAHCHTPDVDRPITYEGMAADTAAALDELGVERADVFGFSMGAGIALALAMARPELVGKLVVAGAAHHPDGMHPGTMEGAGDVRPEDMHGTPFHDDYVRNAPDPEGFARMVSRATALDTSWTGWSADQVRRIAAPALVLVGDGDLVRPEHAVELFRLFGGGVAADLVGPTDSRLAILPGTTHMTLLSRCDVVGPMVTEFLDAPAG